MAYTIEAALNSNQIETIMVSTDSEEYAKIARKYDAIYIIDIDFYNADHYICREGSYAYIVD